jgi:hypothetical protein
MSNKFDGFGKHLKQGLDSANPNDIPQAVGISWFRPETYDVCMSIFSDANDLPDTYEDWLQLAKQVEKQVASQGMKVVRVDIDPETFPKWCAANGLANLDKHARSMFGSAKALEWLNANSLHNGDS